MGTPQWASDLKESELSTEVQDVTKRVWASCRDMLLLTAPTG